MNTFRFRKYRGGWVHCTLLAGGYSVNSRGKTEGEALRRACASAEVPAVKKYCDNIAATAAQWR